MAQCHVNAYHLINQRRICVRDRNILASEREILLAAYDLIRERHEASGCDCWKRAILKLANEVDA